MRIYLNDGWSFDDGNQTKEVRIPHSVVEHPFNYFSHKDYEGVFVYRRELVIDSKDQDLILTFEGVGHKATVYINDTLVGSHLGGYTKFSFRVEEYLEDGPNTLKVEVDTRESLNTPPFGFVVDFLTYGGIYRDVYLDVVDKCHIEDIYFRGVDLLTRPKGILDLTLSSYTPGAIVEIDLIDGDKVILNKIFEPKSTKEIHEFEALGIDLWDIDNPKLYSLRATLKLEGKILDERAIRIGFREADFRADGFYLNGNKTFIRGINRHQSYPYVGYAMPKRAQALDADIIKNELALNSVRTSHYPQSKHFVDRCDELGILVFTEIPGWQHIGDEQWKEELQSQVREMVTEYRNHPSIILWGVRINESLDDDELYSKTNAIARELDPSRQTGGVRYLQKSNLLEDVYTYNDFSHKGDNSGIEPKAKVTKDLSKGYIVSEYNGHMFPTKTYDNSSIRREHTLRHARVLNDLYGGSGVAGGYGWCMFDYNTHKDFGSGDSICHHGIMDMFRNSKLAASVYSSQGPKPFLEVTSEMDIGDYPGGFIGEVYALTNGDGVKLYKNDVFVKTFYPDTKNFPHLPHPPVLIDDFVGDLMAEGEGIDRKLAEEIKEVLLAGAKYGAASLPLRYKLKALKLMAFRGFKLQEGVRLYSKYMGNWGGEATTYRFEAYKGGKPIAEVTKSPARILSLQVIVDTDVLIEENSYDVATVRIRAIDQWGNTLSYCNEPIKLDLSGEAELIGPEIVSLKGGMTGTYVRSIGKLGKANLRISMPSRKGLTPVNIEISIGN